MKFREKKNGRRKKNKEAQLMTKTKKGKERSQAKQSVGEFRKTRHPRNVEFNKVLEACFSGAGISRFSEAWNL
jgi:hypothetical protein